MKIRSIFAVLAIVFWFSAMGLWMYYDKHRPDHLVLETGNILPQNTHGSIVYLTASEHHLLQTLMFLGGVSALIAAVVYFRGKGNK